jgi:hypothetical protein
MNETTPAEVFEALAAVAREHPQWRIGQLVANVAGWADAEVWDVEDDQLLAAATAHLARRNVDGGISESIVSAASVSIPRMNAAFAATSG